MQIYILHNCRDLNRFSLHSQITVLVKQVHSAVLWKVLLLSFVLFLAFSELCDPQYTKCCMQQRVCHVSAYCKKIVFEIQKRRFSLQYVIWATVPVQHIYSSIHTVCTEAHGRKINIVTLIPPTVHEA